MIGVHEITPFPPPTTQVPPRAYSMPCQPDKPSQTCQATYFTDDVRNGDLVNIGLLPRVVSTLQRKRLVAVAVRSQDIGDGISMRLGKRFQACPHATAQQPCARTLKARGNTISNSIGNAIGNSIGNTMKSIYICIINKLCVLKVFILAS